MIHCRQKLCQKKKSPAEERRLFQELSNTLWAKEEGLNRFALERVCKTNFEWPGPGHWLPEAKENDPLLILWEESDDPNIWVENLRSERKAIGWIPKANVREPKVNHHKFSVTLGMITTPDPQVEHG